MLKILLIGAWGAIAGVGAAYMGATMASGEAPPKAAVSDGPVVDGLQYKRPPALTVPMISDGRLRGYVVAKIVYTGEAHAMTEFPVDPQPFVLDEAFRRIYTDGKVEFDKMSKYNLDDLAKAIRTNVNARLGSNLIQDVLFDEVNYVDKNDLKKDGAPG